MAVFNHDYFPYRTGGIWSFNATVKNRRTDSSVAGGVVIRAKAYDEATRTATLYVSEVMGDGCNNRIVYLRKSASGLVEKSSDQKWWSPVFHVERGKADGVSFLLTGDITRPGNMLGTVTTAVGSGSTSVPAGVFSTLDVSAQYMPNGNDPYLYGDDAAEGWDKSVGLVVCGASWVDWSMGYGSYISGQRSIVLAGYSIPVPGGSPLKAGSLPDETLPPQAPIKPAAERLGENKGTVTWEDRALTESGFVLERREPAGAFAEIVRPDQDATSYTDEGIGGGTYYYRVRATNAAGSSAYSDEVTMACSGAPSGPPAPALLDLTSKAGHRMISVATSAPSTEETTGAGVLVRKGTWNGTGVDWDAWVEATGTIPPGALAGGTRQYEGSLFRNADGSFSVTEGATTVAMPTGIYQVRLRMTNARCTGPWGNVREITMP